jgi:hypothetical protein
VFRTHTKEENAMRKTLTIALFAGLLVAVWAGLWSTATAADPPACKDRVFELRTYVTFPGKLEDLHKRFRDHTCALFKKHGIELIGFWTPAEGAEAENTLIYIVAFPSKEAQAKAWASFRADPVWQKAFKESHKNGVIVDQSKLKSQNLVPTDYSPIK